MANILNWLCVIVLLILIEKLNENSNEKYKELGTEYLHTRSDIDVQRELRLLRAIPIAEYPKVEDLNSEPKYIPIPPNSPRGSANPIFPDNDVGPINIDGELPPIFPPLLAAMKNPAWLQNIFGPFANMNPNAMRMSRLIPLNNYNVNNNLNSNDNDNFNSMFPYMNPSNWDNVKIIPVFIYFVYMQLPSHPENELKYVTNDEGLVKQHLPLINNDNDNLNDISNINQDKMNLESYPGGLLEQFNKKEYNDVNTYDSSIEQPNPVENYDENNNLNINTNDNFNGNGNGIIGRKFNPDNSEGISDTQRLNPKHQQAHYGNYNNNDNTGVTHIINKHRDVGVVTTQPDGQYTMLLKILYKFIVDIIFNKRMNLLSPQLIEFITNNPNIYNEINIILKHANILPSQYDPQLLNQLIQLIKNIGMKVSIKDIPQPLIDFILTLQGTNDFDTLILEVVKQRNPSEIESVLLHLLLKYGGKDIPPHIRDWILTLQNGQEIINFLQAPGEINCAKKSQLNNWKIECTKTTTHVDQHDIIIELTDFINDLVFNKKINNISPKLWEFIINNPNLQNQIEIILENENIPLSKIEPEMLFQIIQVIKDNKNNEPIKNIPESLIHFILQLQGTNHLETSMLELLMDRNPSDIKSNLLQIMLKYGNKQVPLHIRNWLLTLPNGQELLLFLQKPGEIKCNNVNNGKIECSKTEAIPQHILELKKFIFDIVFSKKLNDISPQLWEFIIKNPDWQNQIEIILKNENIPSSTIELDMIIDLIQVIKDIKNNEPIKNIPESLIQLIFNLQGATEMEKPVLKLLQQHYPADLKSSLLQLLLKYGSRDVPLHIRNWLLTLPNGQELLTYLQNPGEIKCNKLKDAKIECRKEILVDKYILEELKKFILDIVFNKKINQISPKLWEFIMKNPDLQNQMEIILQTENIPSSKTEPDKLMDLIQAIKDNRNNEPMKNIPEPLIHWILQLEGDIQLEKSVLELIMQRNPTEIKSSLLQIMLKYGNKNVPLHIQNWLSTLPNGQELLIFLQNPGEIKCNELNNDKIECMKELVEVIPQHILVELQQYILDIINNKKINDISPNLLEFILSNPNLQNQTAIILKTENISSSQMDPQILFQLFQLIEYDKKNVTIGEIPKSLQEFVFNLHGSQYLTKIILKWVMENRPADLKQILLQLVKNNGGTTIPNYLREWLLMLPDGQVYIDYLQTPGEITCNREPDGYMECVKVVKQATIDYVPAEISRELTNFIVSINNDNTLMELPADLLQFISNYSDLEKLIFDIFQINNISTMKINPQIIRQLIQIIIQSKANKPMKDIPASLLKIVLNLSGGQNLSKTMLNWINTNQNTDMLTIFLKVIKENGGTVIPESLRVWLQSLPNGKKILEYLQIPGKIECTKKAKGLVQCIKTVNERAVTVTS